MSLPPDWHKRAWKFTQFPDLTQFRADLRRAHDRSPRGLAGYVEAQEEVAFRSWLIRCPDKAAEALIALETALVSERRL